MTDYYRCLISVNGKEAMRQAWSEDEQAVFTQGFVGQQIDLKQYSKPYCQPMKGTRQWKTASKWRRLCHQAGQSILNTLKPSEVNDGDIIQKWIAIVEMTRHETSCKYFCTIQIHVTPKTPQIPHIVKGWATDCWYVWAVGEIFVEYFPKIPSIFCRVSLLTLFDSILEDLVFCKYRRCKLRHVVLLVVVLIL